MAKRSNTRTGSSELSTVMTEPKRMCSVREAIVASTISGLVTAKSGRWCTPSSGKAEPEFVGDDRLFDEVSDHLG